MQTKTWLLIPVTALLLTGTLASVAKADESPFVARRFALDVVAGNTPLGIGGLEAEYAPLPWLVASGGFGRAWHGMAFGGMLRGRLPLGRWALTAGTGFSQQKQEWTEDSLLPDTCKNECAHKSGDVALFNLEGAAEYRSSNGFNLRLFAGYRMPLTDALQCDAESGQVSYDHCVADHGPDGKPEAVPYGGVAVGYAF